MIELDFLKLKYVFIKSAIFVLLFSILHFIYDLAPIVPFAVIGGVSESVFQHLKLAFYAYLFLLPIEYVLLRKSIENKPSFLYTRLLITLFIPWTELIIWYIAPAIVGAELPLAIELTYSFIVVYIMGILGGILEQSLYGVDFKRNARIVIVLLLGVAIFIFTVFTFVDPWIDVFMLPP